MKTAIVTYFYILIIMSLFVNLTVAAVNKWCVAKPSASNVELRNNINYVCQTLRQSNCTQLIARGGYCFQPDTLINHASVVMNRYYAEYGRNTWNCDFKGTGLLTITDPSYSGCKYV